MDGIKKINGFVLGIKYKSKFSLLDDWGSIADDILNDKKGYFNEIYFPKISGQYTTERTLFNEETGNYLKITGHDIVYRHSAETNDFEKEFEEFKERVNKVIIPTIIDKYSINNFVRIGVVFLSEIQNKMQYNKIISNISKIDGINDIRFSQKNTTKDGQLFKSVNDYINKIYTLSINEQEIPIISYDYQYFFNPIRCIFEECKINKIFDSAKKNMEDDLKKMLGDIDGKK